MQRRASKSVVDLDNGTTQDAKIVRSVDLAKTAFDRPKAKVTMRPAEQQMLLAVCSFRPFLAFDAARDKPNIDT